MNGSNYVFSDDSRLFGEVLSKLDCGGAFLEIGVGNGGNQRIVEDKFDLVVGTDVARLDETKRRNPKSELVVADRATCFRESVFDVVAFNPPYVPSNGIVDIAVDGGLTGIEVPLRFLESATKAVKNTGKILMLLSSEDSLEPLRDFCESNNLTFRRLDEAKLFFEDLIVFELKFQ